MTAEEKVEVDCWIKEQRRVLTACGKSWAGTLEASPYMMKLLKEKLKETNAAFVDNEGNSLVEVTSEAPIKFRGVRVDEAGKALV